MKQLPVFDLLRLVDSRVTPDQCKLHFAQYNGNEHPLEEFLGGRFDEWQRLQRKGNFARPFVVSMVEMYETGRWLLAGVYVPGASVPDGNDRYYPSMQPIEAFAFLSGRLVIHYEKGFRIAYPNGETSAADMYVDELMREPHSVAHFPGFKHVDLSFEDLCVVVRQNHDSWRAGLSSVAGIYLITDTTTNQLYVGAAPGQGGFWTRWPCYAASGHGDNVEIKKLLAEVGMERAKAFRFSILEICDVQAGPDEVLARESHWKRILRTRQSGLNAN